MVAAVLGLIGWQGVSTVGRTSPVDAQEHVAYAAYLDAHWSPPSKSVNYEYATPPLFHVLAIGLERGVQFLPSHAVETPWNLVTRGLWLALVLAAVWAMTSVRPRVRVAGLAGIAAAVLWGLDEAVSLAKTEAWSAGQLVSFAAWLGLVLVSGLIAREIWPDRPRRALATGGFVLAYPVAFRMSVLFHPEMLLALFAALAMLFFVRAARLGWPNRLGWALGAACGAAALTRQSAFAVLVCVFAGGLILGRRGALPFLARAAVVTAVVAMPWWVYAYRTWHNPIQSNLEPRASLMMAHQPLSFYISFPLEALVLHPHREHFNNELLPRLHAELWSDWTGAFNKWDASPPRVERVTQSAQGVLGFVADALAIGGLFAIALPAGFRVARRRGTTASDLPIGFLGLLALVAFTGFVVELVRFPQSYGDPIKSSYLLFTAPCWAVFSVAAWTAVVRGRARVQAALIAAAVLYSVSYVADMGAVFSHDWNVAPPAAVDLRVTAAASVAEALQGQEVDYSIVVENAGGQTGDDVRLSIRLPATMRLVGPPYVERGSGCTGKQTITCDLAFLNGGQSTVVRFGSTPLRVGVEAVEVSVTSKEDDRNQSDNAATASVAVVPPTQARVGG